MMISWLRSLPIAALALALVPSSQSELSCEPVSIWRAGKVTGSVCRDEAAALGLTVIDFGDDWVPPVFEGDETDDAPDYRASVQALAQERFDDLGSDGVVAHADRYFELYGIAPTLTVVRGRLVDEARHHCHAAIDDAALASGPERMTEQSSDGALAELRRTRELRTELEHDRLHAKLRDLAALGSSSAYYRTAVARLGVLEAKLAAIRALQAHLLCDELIDKGAVDDGFTRRTRTAVEAFQRGAMLLPTGVFDAETREALVRDSRVRDYETALRVLRERVAAATGLLEDGSAGRGPTPVLGHSLDSEGVWHARGAQALANAAPDLIGPTTEVAALALGWRDPTTTIASLGALQSSSLVAVALPPVPAYHASDMRLHVEIDRGDSARRPALTVFVAIEAGDVALVRWPTTVGGWQRENVGGEIVNRWKPSPKGAGVWRDLFVGPRWLPPASTPDDELLVNAGDPAAVARAQLGPSYRAAFGLVAFVHLFTEREHGQDVLEDEGIRTHATGNLTSLTDGDSHGCHRIVGNHAIRLADFVLAHHEIIRHGAAPTYYRRLVHGRFPVAIDTLGYRIELVPPIPVEVR